MFIPVFQILVKIENEVLIRVVKPKVLPKLDYSKGIPKDQQTMVVIPTIVKDVKKIDEMFELLEKYYLANKSNNLSSNTSNI